MASLNSETQTQTGYFFAPYVPLIRTPVVLDPASFQPRQRVLTSYSRRPTIAQIIEIAAIHENHCLSADKVNWKQEGF